MVPNPPSNSERTIRKIDIGQISISLQDRLGLAKLKYQNDHKGKDFWGSDRPSDSSSEFFRSRCETPLTSPPLRTSTYSKELRRSSRSKHAVIFNPEDMQPMLSASRKRLRSGSISDQPAKMPRVSWKSSYQLPESSPGFNRASLNRHQPVPFTSLMGTIPEPSSPYRALSDEGNDPDLPVHSFQNASSMMSSSPPRTPPPRHTRLSRNDRNWQNENNAGLLLYLANSPTPANVTGNATYRDFPPSTPPSQHAVFPSTPGGGGLFPSFSTPGQPFNFADFVNVTPSPGQHPRGGRTPGGPGKTPHATRDDRKKLNFGNLMPPSTESPRNRGESGMALQLGGELRR